MIRGGTTNYAAPDYDNVQFQDLYVRLGSPWIQWVSSQFYRRGTEQVNDKCQP